MPTLEYTWNIGRGTNTTSCRLVTEAFHAWICRPAQTYAPCVPRTPFGVPVVPPLIRRTAGSEGCERDRRRPSAAVHEQQVREVVVARRDRHAIAVPALAEQREQHAQQRRQVLLDVRGDDAAHRRSRLNPLHPRVEARQRDDGLDAVLAERSLELRLGVHRVQRRDDGAELPGAELRDEELRAVGQHDRDAVVAPDAERRERGRERVAQAAELGPRDGRALEQERGRRRGGRARGRRGSRPASAPDTGPAWPGRPGRSGTATAPRGGHYRVGADVS